MYLEVLRGTVGVTTKLLARSVTNTVNRYYCLI